MHCCFQSTNNTYALTERVPLRQRVVTGVSTSAPPVHIVLGACRLLTPSFSTDGGRRRDGARVGEAALHGARGLLNGNSQAELHRHQSPRAGASQFLDLDK